MDNHHTETPSDTFTPLISHYMDIEDITWGLSTPGAKGDTSGMDYVVRYRGQLQMDVDQAYRQLVIDLRPYQLNPIFQTEDGRQAIFLVRDPYTPLVARVLKINQTRWGQLKRGSLLERFQPNFTVQYLGRLTSDSEKAYDQLASQLRPLNMTPLFRVEGDQHEVTLVEGVLEPSPSNPLINMVLFLLTLLSVLLAGVIYSYQGPVSGDPLQMLRLLATNLDLGIPFAASLLAILLAHEFGHYLAGRYHGTAVTLPYFIPFPFSLLGTMGAFIRLKEPPKNRRILLDIGVAGPLAGLAVAIPVLLLGLSLSQVDRIPLSFPPGSGLTLEGNSILYLLAKYLVFGQVLPAPASYGDMSPVLYWVRYFFTGLPTPLGGVDVIIHPVAWAGWAGLLVTALNLIPAGQLDGGHLIYTLFGRRASALRPFILVALLGLGLVWTGWWLWAFLIYLLGRSYATPLDQVTPLDSRRKAVAILGLIIFVLVFSPVPLRAVSAATLLP